MAHSERPLPLQSAPSNPLIIRIPAHAISGLTSRGMKDLQLRASIRRVTASVSAAAAREYSPWASSARPEHHVGYGEDENDEVDSGDEEPAMRA